MDIPAAVALKAIHNVLYARIEELHRRRGTGSKAAGRARTVAAVREQLALLDGLQARRQYLPDLDAATLGLLVAWANGWTEGAAPLAEHLLATGHPHATAVLATLTGDGDGHVGATCQALLRE